MLHFDDGKLTPVGKGGLKLDFGPKAAERFNEVIVQADSSDETTDDDDSKALEIVSSRAVGRSENPGVPVVIRRA